LELIYSNFFWKKMPQTRKNNVCIPEMVDFRGFFEKIVQILEKLYTFPDGCGMITLRNRFDMVFSLQNRANCWKGFNSRFFVFSSGILR